MTGEANGTNIAPTEQGARIMLDGVLQAVRDASGRDLIDVVRAHAPIAADLCRQGWFEPATVFEAIEGAAKPNGEAAQFRGILLGEFADIYVPQLASGLAGEIDCLNAARRKMALARADDKLHTLQEIAIDLHGHIGAGNCSRPDAVDVLTELADEHGLIARYGRHDVEHVIAWGIEGKSALAPCEAGWPDPDLSLLDDRRGDLPGFPLNCMARWEQWLDDNSRGAGVTPGHVAVPLLSITSSLIGAARRVRPSRSWSEPMTLWTSVVGFSGTGKTPGIDASKRVLSQIERDRKNAIAELRRQHEGRVQTAKAAAKAWKQQVEQAIEAAQPPPEMPAEAMEPGPFVTPRLYASESTIERWAVLLQARPRGLALISDELSGHFLNMGRYSGGSDKEFWLEAWNGKHFVVERMGRPAVAVDHLLIGITGGFQPDKLARSFEGDSDGMHARMLFAWPEEPPYQPLTNDVAEIEPEIQNALARIVDLPSEEDGVFAPRDVWLSDDAVSSFEQFRQFLHSEKNGLDGREREWWAKGPSQVLRLAGTLCYLSWSMNGGPEPAVVGREFIDAAIRLWRDYFWIHSRAALRQIGLSDRHANARRVLRWIRNGRRSEVSREDIRRDALGQRLDAEQTQGVIDGLVKAGWFRAPVKPSSGPGRPAQRWLVNPMIQSQ